MEMYNIHQNSLQINHFQSHVKLYFVLNVLFFSLPAMAGTMDKPMVTKFTMDKFDISNATSQPKYWELDFWVMKGLQKLMIKSEGEFVDGTSESENMLLYSKGIAPYWDIQFGLGYDVNETTSHNWAVVGLAGMMPYFFETEIYALVDGESNIGVRTSSEYDALITQQWILVSEIEATAYSANIPDMEIGSGLSTTNLSLRLKYEIKREFAPYVGINWHKKYGDTASYSAKDQWTSWIAGISFWF